MAAITAAIMLTVTFAVTHTPDFKLPFVKDPTAQHDGTHEEGAAYERRNPVLHTKPARAGEGQQTQLAAAERKHKAQRNPSFDTAFYPYSPN